MNKYLVGMQGNNIVSLKLGFKLTEEEALNLAVWLVLITGDKDKFEELYNKELGGE